MTNDHLLPEPFDHSTLDEQTRELVLRKADETRVLMRRTTEHIIAIGENLLTVQKQLPEVTRPHAQGRGLRLALTRSGCVGFLPDQASH